MTSGKNSRNFYINIINRKTVLTRYTTATACGLNGKTCGVYYHLPACHCPRPSSRGRTRASNSWWRQRIQPTRNCMKLSDKTLITSKPALSNQLPDSFRQRQFCSNSPLRALVISSYSSSSFSLYHFVALVFFSAQLQPSYAAYGALSGWVAGCLSRSCVVSKRLKIRL